MRSGGHAEPWARPGPRCARPDQIGEDRRHTSIGTNLLPATHRAAAGVADDERADPDQLPDG